MIRDWVRLAVAAWLAGVVIDLYSDAISKQLMRLYDAGYRDGVSAGLRTTSALAGYASKDRNHPFRGSLSKPCLDCKQDASDSIHAYPV